MAASYMMTNAGTHTALIIKQLMWDSRFAMIDEGYQRESRLAYFKEVLHHASVIL